MTHVTVAFVTPWISLPVVWSLLSHTQSMVRQNKYYYKKKSHEKQSSLNNTGKLKDFFERKKKKPEEEAGEDLDIEREPQTKKVKWNDEEAHGCGEGDGDEVEIDTPDEIQISDDKVYSTCILPAEI